MVAEAAILKTAGSVVTPVLKGWLSRTRDKRERTSELTDLINTGIADDLGRRRAERRVDEIVDAVYERLRPLVSGRFAALGDNEALAALQAVTDTFAAADLSDRALFADDLDPRELSARLRRELSDVADRAGLSELAGRLYTAVLDECCLCLTQLVLQLRPFPARSGVETLQRLTAVSEALSEVLARLPATSLDAPAGTDHDQQFRARYFDQLVTAFDRLELFGVDVHRYRLETPLSVAYIGLAVSGDAARVSRLDRRWTPGLLRGQADADEGGSVRVEQALGLSQRVLVRGEAGSGKTTLLQWIAVSAARATFTTGLDAWNGLVPFLVRLRRHADGRLPQPEDFLGGTAEALAGLLPPGWVHRQLDAGAILCVDGVDEVPEGQRRHVREWLRGLLTAYPQLRIVVTSRPAAAAARWLEGEGFVTADLERMDPADVRSLIRHWHEAAQRTGDLPCPPGDLPAYEQRLVAQLDGSAHLQALAASPLLCALLCALNLDRDSRLPRNRMDVYQAAVDMLLERRDAQRGVRAALADITSRDLLQLLQQVAWWMVLNGRTEATREQALQQLEQRLAGMRQVTATGDEVLAHLLQRSGILREPVPGRIDLVHRSFQEYLAAREAAEQGHSGALVNYGHLDSWRETIVLAAGHANAPVRLDLLQGLLDRADAEPRRARKLRLLAAACLETAPVVEPPELLERVRRGLRRMLPPRSVDEARSLAGVGEPLLDELPAGPEGLTEAQAIAVVRTAALVNGPKAIRLLAGFSGDARREVQRELANVWDYFDPDEYATQVLADAPLRDGRVEVRNPILIGALAKLRRLTGTSIVLEDLLDVGRLAGVPHLQSLQLWEGLRGDLAALAEHGELTGLDLALRHRRADLSVLRSLSDLRSLWLRDIWVHQDLTPIGTLGSLEQLWLLHPPLDNLELLRGCRSLDLVFLSGDTAPDLAPLGTLPRLTYLGLDYPNGPRGGLAHIARLLPGLEQLILWRCGWAQDLTAIGGLSRLRRLDIRFESVGDLRPLTALKSLESVYLGYGGFQEDTHPPIDVTPLAQLPNLRELAILESTPGLDLTPLRGRNIAVSLLPGVLDSRMKSIGGLRFKTWR
jgi:hypothetical protein